MKDSVTVSPRYIGWCSWDCLCGVDGGPGGSHTTFRSVENGGDPVTLGVTDCARSPVNRAGTGEGSDKDSFRTPRPRCTDRRDLGCLQRVGGDLEDSHLVSRPAGHD